MPDIQFVQSASQSGNGNQVLAFKGPNKAGNLILVMGMVNQATTPGSVFDSNNNKYALLGSFQSANFTFDVFLGIAAKSDPAFGTRNTVTYATSFAGLSGIIIHEFSGVDTVDVFDAAAQGVGNTQASNFIQTKFDQALLVGFTAGVGSNVSAFTPGPDFKMMEVSGTSTPIFESQYRVVSNVGSYSSSTVTTAGKGGFTSWLSGIIALYAKKGTSVAQAQVSPANAVFQGKPGGWPGFASFTDPSQIYIASPLTVNWKTGPITYTFGSSFAIPQQGQTVQSYFVTLADPNRTGTAQIFIDTDAGRWAQSAQDSQPFAALGIVQTYVVPFAPSVTGSGSGMNLSFGSVNIPITGVRFPKAYATNMGASGDNDLYTVPANKLALVVDVLLTNPTGNSGPITALAEAKVAGVYHTFDFISNALAVGNFGKSQSMAPFLLHAGETFAVNTDRAGGSVWASIIEFDATANINDARLFSLASGDNTVFTVPSGKTVQFVGYPSALNLPQGGWIWYWNASLGIRTIKANVVPSGSSPSVNNQIFGGSIPDKQMMQQLCYGSLNPGDFININTDANTATQTAWVIYTLQ